MPSTHLSLSFHLVFSTKDRRSLIASPWRSRLHTYMGGIIHDVGGTPLSIGGTADHVHLLVGLRATHRLADVLREVKHASSQWVHETIGVPGFSWQEGYGAFTVGVSQVEAIRDYIATQEQHHRNQTFREEYLELLRQNGVEYDERYLW